MVDEKKIYMDHNATTPMKPEVIRAMVEVMEKKIPLNSSSVHSYGKDARMILENSRQLILQTIGLDYYSRDHGLIFTSGGTEANNIAIQGIIGYKPITTTVEHHSILKVVGEGLVPVKRDGVIDLAKLEEVLCHITQESKVLFSLSLANNESGVIQSISEIASICQKYNALLHIDAVQALGKIDVDFIDLGADMMTISAHKIGGPVGIGALIYKRKLNLRPIMFGGGQESRLRPGTTNVLLAYGFGIASGLIHNSIKLINGHILDLRNSIEATLSQESPEVIIFGQAANRLANTSLIYMPNVPNEIQVAHFDINGVAVSAGAACSSSVIAASHVVMGMGYNEKLARSSIRVSLGLDNTQEEIIKFLKLWKELYSRCNDDSV